MVMLRSLENGIFKIFRNMFGVSDDDPGDFPKILENLIFEGFGALEDWEHDKFRELAKWISRDAAKWFSRKAKNPWVY